MAKKKKGGKKGGGGGKGPEVQNAVVDLPPGRAQLMLLYRKASFDVLPEEAKTAPSKVDLLHYQLDKTHRAVVPGYCQFLRERKFWMVGDDVPDGAIPKVPGAAKAKGGGKKGKKKK